MNSRPPPGQAPGEAPRDPATTRIGGGGSAHLAAIGVVVVLVALAWIGWSGRPAANPAGAGADASGQPIARAATSVSPASAPSPSPPTGTPQPPGATLEAIDGDVYGLTAAIDGQQYFALLRETGENRLSATVRVPLARPDDAASIELHQLWTQAKPGRYAELGTWQLPLDALDPAKPRGGTVLQVDVRGRPRARGEALLVRRGYRLEVAVDEARPSALLHVDVTLSPRIPRRLGEDGRLDPAVGAGRLFVDRDGAVR